jgi:hypothetical protein
VACPVMEESQVYLCLNEERVTDICTSDHSSPATNITPVISEVFTAVTMKHEFSGSLRCVALVRTDVSEKCMASTSQ